MDDIFSTKGRLGRREYFIRFLFLMACCTIFGLKLEDLEQAEVSVDLIVMSSAVLLVVVLLLIQDIKRLHDLDKNGWYILLNFVPLINLIFMVYLLVKRGTQASNRYGPIPNRRTFKQNEQ